MWGLIISFNGGLQLFEPCFPVLGLSPFDCALDCSDSCVDRSNSVSILFGFDVVFDACFFAHFSENIGGKFCPTVGIELLGSPTRLIEYLLECFGGVAGAFEGCGPQITQERSCTNRTCVYGLGSSPRIGRSRLNVRGLSFSLAGLGVNEIRSACHR